MFFAKSANTLYGKGPIIGSQHIHGARQRNAFGVVGPGWVPAKIEKNTKQKKGPGGKKKKTKLKKKKKKKKASTDITVR